MTGSLDLAPGAALVLDGQEWTAEWAEPQFGRVVLLDDDGRRFPTTMRFLMNHPDCRALSTAGEVAAGRGRQQPTLADLNEHQRAVVTLRLAHLLEAETGFRGGDPMRPGPGWFCLCDVTAFVSRW